MARPSIMGTLQVSKMDVSVTDLDRFACMHLHTNHATQRNVFLFHKINGSFPVEANLYASPICLDLDVVPISLL